MDTEELGAISILAEPISSCEPSLCVTMNELSDFGRTDTEEEIIGSVIFASSVELDDRFDTNNRIAAAAKAITPTAGKIMKRRDCALVSVMMTEGDGCAARAVNIFASMRFQVSSESSSMAGGRVNELMLVCPVPIGSLLNVGHAWRVL